MNKIFEFETERLILRQWKEEDFLPFSEINGDPRVMEFYPSTLSTEESNSMANRLMELISERTWGFWAIETKESGRFIGFVGLHIPQYKLPVSTCVEIGWRLGRQYWGKGYATEAANEALKFAFDTLQLKEVYSFSSVSNIKSRAVMGRLGMKDAKNNFEHPIIPEGHSLREHVLYEITRNRWKRKNV